MNIAAMVAPHNILYNVAALDVYKYKYTIDVVGVCNSGKEFLCVNCDE